MSDNLRFTGGGLNLDSVHKITRLNRSKKKALANVNKIGLAAQGALLDVTITALVKLYSKAGTRSCKLCMIFDAECNQIQVRTNKLLFGCLNRYFLLYEISTGTTLTSIIISVTILTGYS